MNRPYKVKTLLGIDAFIDVSAISRADSLWAGGKFGVRVEVNDRNFILLPTQEACALRRAGVIPAG
jgi:hypothetical protein